MDDKVVVSINPTDSVLKVIQDFVWAIDLGEIDKEYCIEFYQTIIKKAEVVE